MDLRLEGDKYYYRECELKRTSGHVNALSGGTSLDYKFYERLKNIESKNINTVELAQQIEKKMRDEISKGMDKLLLAKEKLGTMNPAFHPYYCRYMANKKVGRNGCHENDHEKYAAALEKQVCLQQDRDEEHDKSSLKVSTRVQCESILS